MLSCLRCGFTNGFGTPPVGLAAWCAEEGKEEIDPGGCDGFGLSEATAWRQAGHRFALPTAHPFGQPTQRDPAPERGRVTTGNPIPFLVRFTGRSVSL
eukprot:9386-Rhodomonas_salina.4